MKHEIKTKFDLQSAIFNRKPNGPIDDAIKSLEKLGRSYDQAWAMIAMIIAESNGIEINYEENKLWERF